MYVVSCNIIANNFRAGFDFLSHLSFLELSAWRDLQISPVYTFMVVLAVSVSMLVECVRGGARIGLDWHDEHDSAFFFFNIACIWAQQFILTALLGVAAEMVDPFGDDLHDIPVFSVCLESLRSGAAVIVQWNEFPIEYADDDVDTEVGTVLAEEVIDSHSCENGGIGTNEFVK